MKNLITRIVAAAMPGRAARIYSDPGSASGLLDRAVKAGLYHRAVAQNDLEHLDWYHRKYWEGEAAQPYFADDSRVGDRPLLIEQFGLDQRIAEFQSACPESAKHVIEIGSGDGRALQHLREQLATDGNFLGLDVNAEQNERNAHRYASSQLQFVTTDAREWISENGRPHSFFLTNGGVLEYFSQHAVAALFAHITERLSPSLFAMIEPLDDKHNLNTQIDSFVYGAERSFSHNYPYLLEQAGFAVHFRAEQRALNHRWIVLLAATDGVDNAD